MANENKKPFTASAQARLVKSLLGHDMTSDEIKEVFEENSIKLNEEAETLLNSTRIAEHS